MRELQAKTKKKGDQNLIDENIAHHFSKLRTNNKQIMLGLLTIAAIFGVSNAANECVFDINNKVYDLHSLIAALSIYPIFDDDCDYFFIININCDIQKWFIYMARSGSTNKCIIYI